MIVGWAALLGVLLALPRARRPGPAGEVMLIALGAVRARQGRFLLAGVATAISVIAVLALLSRLHPAPLTPPTPCSLRFAAA